MTKHAKPVPADSSAQAPQEQPRKPLTDTLKPYAIVLRDLLGRGKTFTNVAKELKQRRPNFTDALKATKMSFRNFVEAFPKLLRIDGSTIYPLGQNTLA